MAEPASRSAVRRTPSGRNASRARRIGLLLAGLIALNGCTSIGAQRMSIDRTDYADHLRETNKEQLLLNIVAMRYGDAPLFLEVSSVISQYTREGSVHVDVPFVPPSGDNKGDAGGTILFRETPTVTYTPLSGDRFARSMLSPIGPASLLAMIEAGWSIDYLFPLAVRSINGVPNRARDPLFADDCRPEFAEVVAALGRLQRSHAIAMHVEHGAAGQFKAAIQITSAATDTDRADLGLLENAFRPGQPKGPAREHVERSIVFGEVQTAPDQLAIGSRSMFEIFAELSQGVDVPTADIGTRAAANPARPGAPPPLIHVHSGAAKPTDAHVAVQYRGHWFWIDGADVQSKRFFLLAQILLSLNDTSGGANAPLVTIPTG